MYGRNKSRRNTREDTNNGANSMEEIRVGGILEREDTNNGEQKDS